MRAPVPFEYYGRDGVERLWQAHVVRQAIGYWEDQRTLHETARAASRGVKPAPNATAKSQDRPSTAEAVEDATVCSRNLLPKQRPVTMEPEEPPFAQSHGTSSSSAVAICHSPSTSHAAPQGSGGSGAVTGFGYQYRTCPTCKVTMSAANIGRHICFDSRTSKPLNPRHDQQTCSKCERTFRVGYFQRHACDAPSSMHHRSGTKPQTDIDSDDEPLVKKPAAKRKRRILSDDEDDSEPDDSVNSDSDSEPPAKKSTADASFKWNCNEIRLKIQTFLASKEMTQAAFLQEIGGVHSTSLGRFMKLKGPHAGRDNRTYRDAHRFFAEREQQEAAQKKAMSSGDKKRKIEADASCKTSFASLLTQLEGVELPKLPAPGSTEDVDSTHGNFNEQFAVYDSCDEVRKKCLSFIADESITTNAFCKAIGVQSKQWTSFLSFKGLGAGVRRQPGAGNSCYYKGYELLEKLRILKGEAKGAKRIKFEQENPRGYSLAHDDGRRWVFGGA